MAIDKNEVICSVTWTVEDLLQALEHEGYEPSEENVRKLLDRTRIRKDFQDRSIEEGWEILWAILDCYDVDLDPLPGEEI